MTDDFEAKTNAWLIKAHKRAEWRKAHPSKKRVGWITSKPGYVPLCGGNSGQDWRAFGRAPPLATRTCVGCGRARRRERDPP